MESAHVLVMAGDVYEDKLHLLVTRLAKDGLPIVVGPGIGGYPRYSHMHDAAALMAVFGLEEPPEKLPYPVSSFADNGRAAIVMLGEARGISFPYADSSWFNLGSWPGAGATDYGRLLEYLLALMDSGLVQPQSATLDDAQIESTIRAVDELRSFTSTVGNIGNVLSDDNEQSQAIRATLAEVGSTYRVVKRVVVEFMAAWQEAEVRGSAAYSAFAHGNLRQTIRNGRAHCTKIGFRYERVGGLHDAISLKLLPPEVAQVDALFDRLANADSDLFATMEYLGESLTAESRVLEILLRTDRKKRARRRMEAAAASLTNLEDALDNALDEFQNIATALGYAEALPSQETKNVTDQSINITIYGDVVKSNVTAAQTIENSSINVISSDASADVKEVLLRLHKATAEMTTHLPAEEAEVASSDLEILSNEIVKESPRRLVWKQAGERLVAVAKKLAEFGIPVIELVTKLTGLLG